MLGSGTQQDPYLISTIDDLANVTSGTSTNWKYYKLTNDLYFTSGVQDSRFPLKGQKEFIEIDGNGHIIHDFYVRETRYNNSNYEYQGIFQRLYYVKFKNLGINNANMTVYSKAGAFCGQGNGVEFERCFVANSLIRGYGTGSDYWRYIGGFVGYGAGACTFTDCAYIGVRNYDTLSIPSNTIQGTSYVGGFIGYGNGHVFNNCYSIAGVNSTHETQEGAFVSNYFVGTATFNNCYTIRHSTTVHPQGILLDTNSRATYLRDNPTALEGFDFDNVWGTSDKVNGGLPTPKIFLPEEAPPIIKDINISSYVNAIKTDYLLDLIIPIIKEINASNYINQIQTDYIIDFVKANIKTVNTGNYANAITQFISWVNLVHPMIKKIQVAHNIQPITVDVTSKFLKVVIKEINTISSIKNLTHDVKRLQIKKSIENLISYLNKITGQTVVISDIKPIEFYAIASHLEKRNVVNVVESLINVYSNEAQHTAHQLQPKTEVRIMAFIGDTVTLNVRFKTSKGNAIDPTDVTLKIFKPTITSFKLIDTISLTSDHKVGVGEYEIDYTIPSDLEFTNSITSHYIVAEFSGMYNGKPTLTRERIPVRFV